MIDPQFQPLVLKIEVAYDARIYDGDPSDAFEIADLERSEMEEDIKNYLRDLVGEPKRFKLTVQPD